MKKLINTALVLILLIPQMLVAQLPPYCTMVADLTPGSGSTEFHDIERIKGQRSHEHFPYVTIAGTYFFSANANATPGGQLWKTQGTAQTTQNIHSNPNFGPFVNLLRFRESIAFFGENPSVPGYREDLFMYLPTGTLTLETVASCASEPPPGYDRFQPMSLGDKVWYRKLKCTGGADIAYDDLPLDAQITNTTSYGQLLGGFGGNMFFAIGGNPNYPSGTELWIKSFFGNTPAAKVKNIKFDNPNMRFLPAMNPGGGIGIFFIAEKSSGTGQSLWRSDGTAAGTVEIGAAFGYHNMMSLGEEIVWVGKDAQGRPTLMRSNGKPGGTRKMATMAYDEDIEEFEMVLIGSNTKGKILFPNKKFPGDVELFAYDLKTQSYGLVKNIQGDFQSGQPDGSSFPKEFMRLGNEVFFTADDGGEYGRELWRTDGTEGGTKLVQDIKVGTFGSHPEGLVRLNSKIILFTADDGVHGRELWKLDITIPHDMKNSTGEDRGEEEITLETLEVAPNPANDHIQIITAADKISQVSLFDMNGRLVRDIQVTDNRVYENIENLAAGIYILRAQTASGNVLNRKFVKN